MGIREQGRITLRLETCKHFWQALLAGTFRQNLWITGVGRLSQLGTKLGTKL